VATFQGISLISTLSQNMTFRPLWKNVITAMIGQQVGGHLFVHIARSTEDFRTTSSGKF
jgi:formate/nitrite transporter FocA (FNT family)